MTKKCKVCGIQFNDSTVHSCHICNDAYLLEKRMEENKKEKLYGKINVKGRKKKLLTV